MSPENIAELGFDLKETLEYLGFSRELVGIPNEIHWSYADEFLFSENRLTEGLAKYFKLLTDILKEIENESLKGIQNDESGL